MVAGAMLTVALALVATPGAAGSLTPSAPPRVPASEYKPVTLPSLDPVSAAQSTRTVAASTGLAEVDAFVEPPPSSQPRPTKPSTAVSQPYVGTEARPPRAVLHGLATWYDNGTTAMRLPRGTTVQICGGGGCIIRTITDYGPVLGTGRIADLMPADFRAICGCGWWVGVQTITVSVY